MKINFLYIWVKQIQIRQCQLSPWFTETKGSMQRRERLSTNSYP